MAGRQLLTAPWRTYARAAPLRAAFGNLAVHPATTLSRARQAAGSRWQNQAGERLPPWLRLLGGSNRRSMSQSSGGSAEPAKPDVELPSMEKVLRSLYMRVHPDLFVSFPAARQTNEEGLKASCPPSEHRTLASKRCHKVQTKIELLPFRYSRSSWKQPRTLPPRPSTRSSPSSSR